jgi:hypothetical protein
MEFGTIVLYTRCNLHKKRDSPPSFMSQFDNDSELNLRYFKVVQSVQCTDQCNLLYQLNAHYYSHVNVTYIAPICFGTNAPSSGST